MQSSTKLFLEDAPCCGAPGATNLVRELDASELVLVSEVLGKTAGQVELGAARVGRLQSLFNRGVLALRGPSA